MLQFQQMYFRTCNISCKEKDLTSAFILIIKIHQSRYASIVKDPTFG